MTPSGWKGDSNIVLQLNIYFPGEVLPLCRRTNGLTAFFCTFALTIWSFSFCGLSCPVTQTAQEWKKASEHVQTLLSSLARGQHISNLLDSDGWNSWSCQSVEGSGGGSWWAPRGVSDIILLLYTVSVKFWADLCGHGRPVEPQQRNVTSRIYTSHRMQALCSLLFFFLLNGCEQLGTLWSLHRCSVWVPCWRNAATHHTSMYF